MSLWLVYWAFKLATGKEGMGFGDFKLFAALGAWFGWQALIPIILMSSVIGAIVGIAMKFSSGLREGGYIPFGPFLAGAGLTAMLMGPSAILSVIGL
jgi:leader peptidase (prepilin peptidase)/N-methyltransferase